MKKIISLLFVMSVAIAAHAVGRSSAAGATALNPHASKVYESVSNAFAQGKITADSVVSLARYHKVWSPQLAEQCLRLVADQNLQAMTELGLLYTHFETAYLFPSHAKEGVALLERASSAGSSDARDYLGIYYQLNNDFKKANSYFTSSGEHNPMGQVILGGMYENGEGVKKDLKKARELYHQAALQGNHNGASKYGFALQRNWFGPVSYPDAFFWTYIAGELGNDAARTNLWLPRHGQRFGDDFHTLLAQRSLALTEASRKGQSFSQEPIYRQGFLAGLKEKEAQADKGDELAAFYLGSMNYNGDFFNQNYARAAQYYEPIARSGRLPSSILAVVNERLGKMYRDGKGVKVDKAKADRYTRTAARLGSLDAYKFVENIKD